MPYCLEWREQIKYNAYYCLINQPFGSILLVALKHSFYIHTRCKAKGFSL